MPLSGLRRLACFALPAIILGGIGSARAEGNLKKVKHIIILMQENHSFDNYFGALAYAPGSPYHTPGQDGGRDEGNDASGCLAGIGFQPDDQFVQVLRRHRLPCK